MQVERNEYVEKEHSLDSVVCEEKYAQKTTGGSDAEPEGKMKPATTDKGDDEQLGSKSTENCDGLHFSDDASRQVDGKEGDN